MLKERKRNRLNNFDYSTPGFYFITICVHSELFGRNIFGTIKNGKMLLNKYGSIVDNVWQNLPCHYNNCALDKFIIMPNHFHGIVIIVGDNNIVGNGFKPFRTGIQNAIISDTGIQNECAKQS